MAPSCILILLIYFTIMHYQSLNYARKIGFSGLIVSFLILTIISVIDHYVTDIPINTLHVGALILPPIFMFQYIERKHNN